MCLTFIQLMSKWLKKEFMFFVNFKSRHPLVGVPFSTNGTQEPLNQQTNHHKILSQSIKQEIFVCVCVSVSADSLFVYCQTWVTAAGFWVRVEQAQLCWGKVDKTTKTEETFFCFCLSALVSAQKNLRLEMYVFALWSPVALWVDHSCNITELCFPLCLPTLKYIQWWECKVLKINGFC